MLREKHHLHAEHMENVYKNAERFLWDAEQLNAGRLSVYTDPSYAKLPRWAKTFVEGVSWHLDKMHWRKVVFSYSHNGVRYTIEDPAYKKINPRDIDTSTGCFVYRESPTAFFTKPGDHEKR